MGDAEQDADVEQDAGLHLTPHELKDRKQHFTMENETFMRHNNGFQSREKQEPIHQPCTLCASVCVRARACVHCAWQEM